MLIVFSLYRNSDNMAEIKKLVSHVRSQFILAQRSTVSIPSKNTDQIKANSSTITKGPVKGITEFNGNL